MTSYAHLDARQRLATLGGLMLTLLLAAMDQTIVGTAMPRVVASLDGFDRYPWVTTAYLLTSTIAVPVFAKLSDLYGRKWLYLAGLVIFVVSSWLCGAAGNFPLPLDGMNQLILFRGLQGIGGGAVMGLTFTIIGDLFSPAERGRYQGMFGAVFGLSSIVGPLAGGFITDHLSWRWAFYVNAPLGIVALGVLYRTFPYVRPHGSSRTIDWLGLVTLSGWIVPLLLALSRVTGAGWTDPTVAALLAVAGAVAGRVRVGGTPGDRAADAALALRHPHHRAGLGRRLRARHGDVRDVRLPAALPAGRARHVGGGLGHAVRADDLRDDPGQRRLGADRVAHRPLQVPGRRRRGAVNGRHGAAGAARDRRARRRRSCGAWSCAASASAPRSRSMRWRCRTPRRAPSSARPPPPASSSARLAARLAWRSSARCCWASTTSGWRRRCRSTRRPRSAPVRRQSAQHEPAEPRSAAAAHLPPLDPAVAAGVRASLAAGMQRIFVLSALVMASSVVLNVTAARAAAALSRRPRAPPAGRC